MGNLETWKIPNYSGVTDVRDGELALSEQCSSDSDQGVAPLVKEEFSHTSSVQPRTGMSDVGGSSFYLLIPLVK